VEVKENLVDLKYEGVLRIKVLTALSDKTRIIFRSSEPMTEEIALKISGLPVQYAVKRLLEKRGVIFIFGEGRALIRFPGEKRGWMKASDLERINRFPQNTM
jgi:hypothetical protein